MIGLVSGTVTAAARSLGHYIALSITGFLMLIVGAMLWRDGKYKRDWMADEEEYGNKWGKYRRWAPTIIFAFAYPLIIASPLQHVLADVNLWPICGNNPTYPRINTSNAYPDHCWSSSMEYKCSIPCCVSTWMPNNTQTPEGIPAYDWFPPTSTFWPSPTTEQNPFGTLTDNLTVYFPGDAYPFGTSPYFPASLNVVDGRTSNTTRTLSPMQGGAVLFDALGNVNLKWGGQTDADCFPYKHNPLTGYCLMEGVHPITKQNISLLGDGGTCDCGACVPNETMSYLSPMGVLFTIVFTYIGFALLAVAVLWNADFIEKMKGVREKWRELRQLNAEHNAALAAAASAEPLVSGGPDSSSTSV